MAHKLGAPRCLDTVAGKRQRRVVELNGGHARWADGRHDAIKVAQTRGAVKLQQLLRVAAVEQAQRVEVEQNLLIVRTGDHLQQKRANPGIVPRIRNGRTGRHLFVNVRQRQVLVNDHGLHGRIDDAVAACGWQNQTSKPTNREGRTWETRDAPRRR